MSLPVGTITRHELADLLSDAALRGAVEAIAAENYGNASVLLAQEYVKNNRIYLFRAGDAVRGFFMVGWAAMECAGERVESVFLGLSAVAHAHKGEGIGGQLYRTFFRESRAWELEHGRALLLWFHTASPLVAKTIWKLCPEIAPAPDGTCDPELLEALLCVRRTYGMDPYASAEAPYLLRGYAKARYAEAETERLRSAAGSSAEDNLLTRLHLDERNGDRLLMVARPPKAAA